MTDRYPTRTGGLPYTAPSNAMFGIDWKEGRERVVQEFGKVATAIKGFPPVSVNSLQTLWVQGSEFTLASATTAPAVGVRFEFPVSVYGTAAARDGAVSLRVTLPGIYRARLAWAQDAPGGGTLAWLCRVNKLGTDYRDGDGPNVASVGTAYAHGTTGPVTNLIRWSPIADVRMGAPGIIGVTVGRDPTAAPDTATAAAYLIGLALERIGER